MKRYTVKQVAQLSGVSVRTLHYYDEIGLLKPACYGDNRYRYYEREQLLLLQQILFYRELEIPVDTVREILSSSSFDKIEALREHKKQLLEKSRQLRGLVDTIDKTIAHLKGEIPMKDQELYAKFAPEKQAEYEKYLITQWGKGAEEKIQESKRRIKGWKKEDFARASATITKIHQELTEHLKRGARPSDAEVQLVMRRHYEWLCLFWTPDKHSYPGLGQLYLEHPDFRKTYDAFHPELAGFLAQAMKEFAARQL